MFSQNGPSWGTVIPALIGVDKNTQGVQNHDGGVNIAIHSPYEKTVFGHGPQREKHLVYALTYSIYG